MTQGPTTYQPSFQKGFFAEAPIAEVYRWFADEAAPTSPTWERVCRFVAETPALTSLLDSLEGGKRQPNLFLAALRYLDGPTEPGEAFVTWVQEHSAAIRDVICTHTTQTNEVGRCAVVVPLLAGIQGPIALIEVGASAGLCLFPDRYGYRWWHAEGGATEAGDDSIVRLASTTKGTAPAGYRLPQVVWRAAIDLNPLDPSDPEVVRWLRSLVWPGETEREARLVRCLEAVAAEPVLRVRGDATEALAGAVAQAPRDATVVVTHSAVLAYLDTASRRRHLAELSRLGVRWTAQEGRTVVPGIDGVPADPRPHFVASLDGHALALASSHGHWIDWL